MIKLCKTLVTTAALTCYSQVSAATYTFNQAPTIGAITFDNASNPKTATYATTTVTLGYGITADLDIVRSTTTSTTLTAALSNAFTTSYSPSSFSLLNANPGSALVIGGGLEPDGAVSNLVTFSNFQLNGYTGPSQKIALYFEGLGAVAGVNTVISGVTGLSIAHVVPRGGNNGGISLTGGNTLQRTAGGDTAPATLLTTTTVQDNPTITFNTSTFFGDGVTYGIAITPEPSSALLSTLGIGLLTLRRRRQ